MIGSEEMQSLNSQIQKDAKTTILRELEALINIPENSLLGKELVLKDNTGVVLDGFNENEGIIVEVYPRIGKLVAEHERKIVTEIMKILLTEKVLNKEFRKIVAVCDDLVYKQLTGSSWKSLAISEFNVEVIKVDIDRTLRNTLLESQKSNSSTQKKPRWR